MKRRIGWGIALVFVWGTLLQGATPWAQAKDKKSSPRAPAAKARWAQVDGFRSARFGMREKEVYRAIFKDFRIPRRKVTRQVHPVEKTTRLGITVPELLADGGPAYVLYIFGYNTRELIEVDVLWGKPVDPKPNPQQVVNVANQLRHYFTRQRFQRDGLVVNGRLPDGSILVFRGKDRKGRMVVLHLSNPPAQGSQPNRKITLRLSYIESPDSPDIFSIEKGEF